MEDMSKEINRLKMKSVSNKNMGGSAAEDTSLIINLKRLEEKCRGKDFKIDELKQNIFLLEETVMKLKKK